MTDLEAKELIEAMRDRAVNDFATLQRRIAAYKADYEKYQYEETAAQITRLEDRLVVKGDEAKALAIAASKF